MTRLLRWLLNWRFAALVVALIVLLTALSVTSADRPATTRVEQWFVDALAPFARGANAVAVAFQRTAERIARFRTLEEENARLQAELQALREKERLFERTVNANLRLRSLLGLKEHLGMPVVAANVTMRDPNRWLEQIVIDVGARDGVRPGMAVVDQRGVVGRVLHAGQGLATVMLLTDPQSGVGVMVEHSEDIGVAVGDPQRPGLLSVRFFARDPDVAIGDRIVTSGLGSFYPPGLPVGTVVDVSRDAQKVTTFALVEPAARLERLQEVLVLERVVLPDDEPRQVVD